MCSRRKSVSLISASLCLMTLRARSKFFRTIRSPASMDPEFIEGWRDEELSFRLAGAKSVY
jgi:hypothetical protein